MIAYFVPISDLLWWKLFCRLIYSQKTYSDEIIYHQNVTLWVMKTFIVINQFSFRLTFSFGALLSIQLIVTKIYFCSQKVLFIYLLLLYKWHPTFIYYFLLTKNISLLNFVTKNTFCFSVVCSNFNLPV